MANPDSVFGARIISSFGLSPFSGKVHPYTVLASDASALFYGDVVKHTGTSAPGSDNVEYPVVTLALEGDLPLGIVVGFLPDPDNLNRIYRPASTLRTVYVCDDPYVEFEMQANAAVVATDIGLNVDFDIGAGSTYTGISGTQLQMASKGAGSAQARLVRLSNRQDNDFGQYAKVTCIFNEHFYKQTAGV